MLFDCSNNHRKVHILIVKPVMTTTEFPARWLL
jgi:hypothetical protein